MQTTNSKEKHYNYSWWEEETKTSSEFYKAATEKVSLYSASVTLTDYN